MSCLPCRLAALVLVTTAITAAPVPESDSTPLAKESSLALAPPPAAEPSGTPRTDNMRLDLLLKEMAVQVTGGNGQWRFEFESVPMMMFSDQNANRMRIIAPVVSADELSEADMRTILEANFDRALDAKYAIYRGLLWSTYVHPLGELTPEEFESGLKQVYTLRATYGTTYTSTDQVFGADTDE